MATEITRFPSRGIQWSEAASFAWAAGLIEGEGCITTQRSSPVVEVAMTDGDVISRFTEIVDAPLWGPYPRPGRWKSIWKTRVTGEEHLTDLFVRIEPFLGARRRGRFQELVLASSDEDVVARFAEIVGGRVRGPYEVGVTKAGQPKLQTFRWQVGGPAACSYMATQLRPWLGERRRSKPAELTCGRFTTGLDQALNLEKGLWERAADEPSDFKTPGQGTFPREPRSD